MVSSNPTSGTIEKHIARVCFFMVNADVAKLVDALDLGSSVEIREGSSPFIRTIVSICGGIAQLGEHLLCKQGVNGSIPFTSTKFICGISIMVL